MQENVKKYLFNSTYLSGDALSRSTDFTKNTLDIKSGTGIGATTSILNIKDQSVIAVFPLVGVIQAKEAKRNKFKSDYQFFIYSKSKDRWSDVERVFKSGVSNVIICTTADQIVYLRQSNPPLFDILRLLPCFIDEIHLFSSNAWRRNLATFINILTNEWKGNYKFSTATPSRDFESYFNTSNLDIAILQREGDPPKQIKLTQSTSDAWSYVFTEMEAGRNVVIFSNDVNHHKKEFIKAKSINLTGEGLAIKLAAFGKGLDYFKDEIDTTFLNKFPLIFVSSKYLTGYDIEPKNDTSILIMVNNRDESTLYNVEDIIQAYGRVRVNLYDSLLCVSKVMIPPTLEGLEVIKRGCNLNYESSLEIQSKTPKNRDFNIKSFNNFALDNNGFASRLLAFDKFLKAESEYILFNDLERFLIGYNFILKPFKAVLSKEQKTNIQTLQHKDKVRLRGVKLNDKVRNILEVNSYDGIFERILKISKNPKTRKNKSGFSIDIILTYCIGYMYDFLPTKFFDSIPQKDQRSVRGLIDQVFEYININYPDSRIKKTYPINNKFHIENFAAGVNPPNDIKIEAVIRVFRYCYHVINLNFDNLSLNSRKTIDLFYWIEYYKIKYHHLSDSSIIKRNVISKMKGYDLTDGDLIRIDKKLKSNFERIKTQDEYRSLYVSRIKEANLFLMSGNESVFVSSIIDNREYNPLTNLSTIFRGDLLYYYKSIDVVAANAQFTDMILNTNIGLKVYENLIKVRHITRDRAKVLYNSTLNNHKLSESVGLNVFIDAGYKFEDAMRLTKLTTKEKGGYFKLMTSAENDIITRYKNTLPGLTFRLHDSLIIEDRSLELTTEINGVLFKIDNF